MIKSFAALDPTAKTKLKTPWARQRVCHLQLRTRDVESRLTQSHNIKVSQSHTARAAPRCEGDHAGRLRCEGRACTRRPEVLIRV